MKDSLSVFDSQHEYQCLWPGCKKKVQRYQWGCKKHWEELHGKLKQRMKRIFPSQKSIRSELSLDQYKLLKLVDAWVVVNDLEEGAQQ